MTTEYRKGAHTVCEIEYHFVRVTKYGYQVLRGEIADRTRDLSRQVCMAKEITVLKGHVSRDHVHLYVAGTPNRSPPRIVQYVKGKSSRILQEEFPALRKCTGGNTSGHVASSVLRRGQ